MGRFDGMKGIVLGVANDHSIAWAIAKEILAEGGAIGFSHLPDRPDDERQRNRRRVSQLTDPEPNAKFGSRSRKRACIAIQQQQPILY